MEIRGECGVRRRWGEASGIVGDLFFPDLATTAAATVVIVEFRYKRRATAGEG